MEQNSPAGSVPTAQVEANFSPEMTPVSQATVPLTQTTSTMSDLNYASFGQRFLALFVDSILLGIAFIVVIVPVGIMGAATGNDGTLNPFFSVLIMLIQLLVSVLGFAYMVFFIGRSGQTIGKKVMKIKVVKLDTMDHLTYGGAVLREVLGKMVSGITFYVGYLWMLWDPQKQTLHDKIAGTIVVKV